MALEQVLAVGGLARKPDVLGQSLCIAAQYGPSRGGSDVGHCIRGARLQTRGLHYAD